ncbi:hypothetical protein SEEE4018_10217 [Salmonella enterica subsp. enterica serovar Enteritidis str. 543463 40-18]|nr:hypothetical protein SEEE4018_10217 [Salmonella enterica subsp. enterica serovar Enteritidis str. 543463 40-18]CGX42014.1 Uncharacterised protein [Salmonella enterica subsp. enterica serovar Typhi]CXB35019.1 Uncharacterised protein [Salmonella enterica subsp. enterica serovar Typhi]CXD63239.1 Uncharacterised protein [Salmonella enterica subsp. enterica serovar Typhi]
MITVRQRAGEPDGILGRNHPHRIFHLTGDRAVQSEDQLSLAMLMARAKQFIIPGANTKGHSGIVVKVGIVTVQSQANHYIVRF